MVDKNELEESDFQASLQFNHIAYRWDQEVLSEGHNDEDSVLTTNSDPYKTPKSQKIKSSGEVKRWASVVKAAKNYQQPTESSESDSQVKTSEMIDSVFKLLPKNFEAQKGFITSQNTLLFCVPCTLELDSVIAIANHLKTRKHEDCIISHLKGKIPPQLGSIMEYVSFFGFNLCCNLCRSTISMFSYNPYKTIVNIIAHNACTMHTAQRATANTYNSELTHVDDHITNTITKESSISIDKKMITDSTQPDEFQMQLSNISASDKTSLKSTVALNMPLVDVFSDNQSTHLKEKQSRLKDLLSSIPSGLLHVDCIVENDKGSITCLICNRVVPPSSHNLYTHLRGSNHKKNKDKLNPSSMKEISTEQNAIESTEKKHISNNVYESDLEKKIPVCLRSLKTHIVQVLASKEIESHFEKIMISNLLISENDNFLVRNIDGKNSYCKLCRTLMPLSTDLSVLEKNLIDHFQNMKHVTLLPKTALLHSEKRARAGRVARSLFVRTENDIEPKKYFEETGMNNKDTKEIQEQSNKLNCNAELNATTPQKKENKDVLLTKTATQKSFKIKKVRCLKVETEEDEQVLSRRQKQISYGKNTIGYNRYCQLVPKGQRKPRDPVTPPRHAKCSRRTWDGIVRAWRRRLHTWDPPQPITLDAVPWLTGLPCN